MSETLKNRFKARLYLNKDFTQTQKSAIETKISNQVGVKGSVFESRQEAFKNAEKNLGTEYNYLQGFDPVNKNPFPDSFHRNPGKTGVH